MVSARTISFAVFDRRVYKICFGLRQALQIGERRLLRIVVHSRVFAIRVKQLTRRSILVRLRLGSCQGRRLLLIGRQQIVVDLVPCFLGGVHLVAIVIERLYPLRLTFEPRHLTGCVGQFCRGSIDGLYVVLFAEDFGQRCPRRKIVLLTYLLAADV